MKRFLTLLALFAAFSGFAEEDLPRYATVNFSSSPEGAQVFVNGESKNRTPFKISDMVPGKPYHVRMEMDDHEPYDAVFTPLEGYNEPVYAKLKPLKGILLVTSEPQNAEITLNGYSLGETPRLITTLLTKEYYTLVLKKTGYLDGKIEVRFNGRRPLVRNVKLVLNSGVADIKSDPEGAEVILNGISRGVTPVVVSEIPNGRMSLVLKKDGYKTVIQEIAVNAGDKPNLHYALEPLPGRVNLTSVPSGVRFYVNGEPRGNGPLSLRDVKPGTYTVKAEMDGFDPLEREITVGNGAVINEEFRLVSNLAKLEIRTKPSGVTVEVDSRKYGRTKGSGDRTQWSESFIIPNLKAGEHTVRLSGRGFAEVVEHPVLRASSTKSLKIPMTIVFTPDVRITTSTETIDGVMKDSTGTYITLEVKPGVERTIQKENIRDIRYLDGRQ